MLKHFSWASGWYFKNWPDLNEAYSKLFRHSATAMINFKPPVVLYSRLTIFPNVNVMWPQMSSIVWLLNSLQMFSQCRIFVYFKMFSLGNFITFFLQQCILPSALPENSSLYLNIIQAFRADESLCSADGILKLKETESQAKIYATNTYYKKHCKFLAYVIQFCNFTLSYCN